MNASPAAGDRAHRASRVDAPPGETVHVVCAHCATKNRLPRSRLEAQPRCGRCKALLLDGRPVDLSAAGLERHLAGDELPLVVDFWAPWCAPCRMMAPAYEQAAAQLAPGVRLAKLDTEANAQAAERYGIRSIPTLIAFRNGREVARRSGASDRAGLLQWITEHV